MNRDRYQQIKKILLLASEKHPRDRDAYLAEVCGADRELREQVRSIIEFGDVETHRLGPAAWDWILSHEERSTTGDLDAVLGHYRVVEKVGEGGMGVVWKAVDTSLEREVAIKLLPENLAGDPQWLARFRREAKIVASLNHPNIIVIHAVEPDGPVPFMVMEFVRGRSLRDCIPSAGARLGELLDYAIPIADALATAHESGVTHRDVKPENVMVTSDGRVKVLDFGIAATTPSNAAGSEPRAGHDDGLTAGTRIGTPPYMSPEQIRGEPIDPRSDVFSFGILLHEMAVGSRPFVGNTAADLAATILRDDPLPPSSHRADLPLQFDAIVSRCLEKDRSDRPPTARPVGRELVDLRRWVERAALQNLAWSGEDAQNTESAVWSPSTSGTPGSIGVLPFLDLSPARDQGHLCVGIAEDVATGLARTPGLKVTVASRMDRNAFDPREMGRVLRVDAILDGSVRRFENGFRVTARIVNVHDGIQLWSERFDRDIADVFAVQDEVAEAVARHFDMQLAPRGSISRRDDPDAYSAYLRGRHFWGKRYEGGLKRALECFAEALSIDPRMAVAHAGRADCFVILGHYGIMDPNQAYAQAREGAQRALALAPDLAEAHTTMGWISAFYDWTWPEAGRWFGQAIEVDPHYATAREWNAIHLLARGRRDAALESATSAHRLDPLSPMISTILAWIHDVLQHDEEALRVLNTVLDMDPRFSFAYIVLSILLATTDRADEAVATMERGITLTQREGLALAALGFAYGRANRTADAEQVVEEQARARERGYVPSLHVALTHLGMGRHDEALDLLERAVEERDTFFSSAHMSRMFDEVRDDPRYRALMREMKLDAAERKA